jgi:hypothetical protein
VVDARFWWRNLRERDHFGDPPVVERIILKWISESGMGGMNWIKLGQNRDGRRAGINAVLILRVPYNAGDF